MSTHRWIDRLCWTALALVLILTLLFVNGKALGIQEASTVMGYEDRLFDTARVHTLDIVMDGWDSFLETCENEEYASCAVVIDGESYRNVGIRAKGNTSLSSVAAYGNDRYSFKIEFDCYDSKTSYYGLDKLSLNNIIQDNTYMKDFLSYQMMAAAGAAAPLCSYVYITVNGEDWGLYLAVESIEDAFLQRNYGRDAGNLYKPDSTSFGGGRGNGRAFDMENFEPPENRERQNMGNPMGGGMGSSDVKLQYIDDDPDSYANIFDNAKTDITSADKERLIASLKTLSSGENLESAVDVDAVIRYFVAHTFVCNGDSYTGSMVHNYYLYEKDGRLSMLPWDYNLAFGGFDAASSADSIVNASIDSPVTGGSLEDRPMVAWIFGSEDYTRLYHQIYEEFITNYFDSGAFTEMIDSVTALIRPYVDTDPTKFCTLEEFDTGAAMLKTFCLRRAESVRGQLDGSGALADASDISISAMGSMNNGGGPGGMGGGFPQEMQQRPEQQENGQTRGQPPQMGETPQPAEAGGNQTWMLLAVSGAVLLLGLLIAYKFKR